MLSFLKILAKSLVAAITGAFYISVFAFGSIYSIEKIFNIQVPKVLVCVFVAYFATYVGRKISKFAAF